MLTEKWQGNFAFNFQAKTDRREKICKKSVLARNQSFHWRSLTSLWGMSRTLSEQAREHSSQANLKDGGRSHPQLPAAAQPGRSPLKGSQSSKRGTTRSGGRHYHPQLPGPSRTTRRALLLRLGGSSISCNTDSRQPPARPSRPPPAAAELRQPNPIADCPAAASLLHTQPPPPAPLPRADQQERQVAVATQGSGSRPGGCQGT